jgi:hypothetical protein
MRASSDVTAGKLAGVSADDKASGADGSTARRLLLDGRPESVLRLLHSYYRL